MSHPILQMFFALLTATAAMAEPVRLGLSAPLSGGGAGWGNDVKNVLLFANEKLAAGRYSFIFEDDLCDPKTALGVARKFSNVDRIRQVFVVCGQTVMAAAKEYNQAGITVMAPLATPGRISRLGVFRTGLNDELAAKKLADFIGARHKAVHVLTEENDYPVSFLADFQANAERISLRSTNQTFLPDQRDFRTQAMRLKNQNAEAVFLNTQTEEALALLLRQFHEIKFEPALYGAYLPGSAHFLEIGAALAEGLVFVDFPGAQELLTAEGKALYAEFTSKYGPLQGWSFAFPATFEAFRAVHLAISSGKPVPDFLRATQFSGIFGPYSFSQNGDLVGPKHVLRVIRRGIASPLPGD